MGQRPEVTWPLENPTIKAAISVYGISSLTCPSDNYGADIVGNRAIGRTRLVWKVPGGEWTDATSDQLVSISVSPEKVVLGTPDDGRTLKLEQTYTLNEKGIDLDVVVTNTAVRE
jgi:hypothetical protein